MGLVALCGPCHREEERGDRPIHASVSSSCRSRILKNREADDAAKLARGHCECDENCHRPVTMKDVGMFEWDHLMQSFKDTDYHMVSELVNNGAAPERCDRERAKCRLLYILCHRHHTARQTSMRAQHRAQHASHRRRRKNWRR
jgi:hypothetical protein